MTNRRNYLRSVTRHGESNRLTMWKTVAMRIRGATTELEEAGLETDGMVESTSKLQALVKGITGFDIMADKDTFKSTYDMIIGIGEKYKSLSDIDQASLLEALAGKRQANALAAALNNIDDIKAAYTAAEDSAGSAAAENAEYLDSIAGKTAQFQSQFEALSTSVMDDEFIKGSIDTGTGFLGILTWITDKLGTIPTLVTAASAAFSLLGKDAGKQINMPPYSLLQNEIRVSASINNTSSNCWERLKLYDQNRIRNDKCKWCRKTEKIVEMAYAEIKAA